LFVGWAASSRHFERSARDTAIPMLVGVWLLGGLSMTIAATFGGGGFVGPEGLRGAFVVIALSLVPIYTFIMATYDGSLGALMLVTVVMLRAPAFPLSFSKTKPRANQ
jgi:hypothetical protein